MMMMTDEVIFVVYYLLQLSCVYLWRIALLGAPLPAPWYRLLGLIRPAFKASRFPFLSPRVSSSSHAQPFNCNSFGGRA